MGVDKNLYHKDKCVVNLGRAYHFQNLWNHDDINEFIIEIAAKMHWPLDYEELGEQVREFAAKMHGFIDECKRLGASELLEFMLENPDVTARDE